MDDDPIDIWHLRTYENIRGGRFQSASELQPIHETPLRRLIYGKHFFHEGIPIYYSGPEGFIRRDLQRGYADFGKIHVAGRIGAGQRTLTIEKGPTGNPVTREADDAVHEYAREAHAARQTFGDTAAFVAYGHNLDRAPHKFRLGMNAEPTPPTWEHVEKEAPVSDDIQVSDAREILNNRRFIRFRASDDRSILDVRLLADGRKERNWLVSMRPIFHP